MTEVTPLLELTDEELEALEEAPQRRLVPLPWLMTLSDERAVGATAAGLRSLAGRGLVALPAASDGDAHAKSHEIEIEIDRALADVMDLRTHASAVSLWTAADGSSWSLHGFLAEGGALLEEVNPSGRHRFAMAELKTLAAAFGEFASMHAGTRDGDGVPVVHFGVLQDRLSGPIQLFPVAVDAVEAQFPADEDW